MSLWNPENIRDVAESVGITSLQEDVALNLARDVEFRVAQVIDESLTTMRHSRRTIFATRDVSQALRALDIEPLYGYESIRPLRFGEASIGPGQPLFYVEDEEMDFEKLINAPLPKVPREISFTGMLLSLSPSPTLEACLRGPDLTKFFSFSFQRLAHWLAVEGVQPSIPQNPTSAESRSQDLLPKGSSGASANLAGLTGGGGGSNGVGGSDSVHAKPLVKHVLSKELQLYFERICTALLDESNPDFQVAALSSLRTDPGLHQLVPYFVQFISEKVTHHLKNIFVLTQMMHLASALIDNQNLYLDPYVSRSFLFLFFPPFSPV